jgi:uncharacterized membrane protein
MLAACRLCIYILISCMLDVGCVLLTVLLAVLAVLPAALLAVLSAVLSAVLLPVYQQYYTVCKEGRIHS